MLSPTCIKQWYNQSHHTVVQRSYSCQRPVEINWKVQREEQPRLYSEHAMNKKKTVCLARLPTCSVLILCSGVRTKLLPFIFILAGC